MLTMRAAAALLSNARTVDSLADVVRGSVTAAVVAPLGSETVRDLDLAHVRTARLVGGPGALRILVVECDGSVPFRDALRRAARTLSTRAPHVLWLVAAIDGGAANAAIIGWTPRDGSDVPRVASFVWEPSRVTDSDAETLCALSAVRSADDILLHARCVEIIGRESLTRRFYRALRAQVDSLASSVRGVRREEAQEIALLYTSRLLFICFLQAKGWLDGDRAFMSARFDACMESGGRFHHRVLLPLFFGTLNTPHTRRSPAARDFGAVPFLNGGLFSRTHVERRLGRARFSDEALGAMLDELFCRFRFVAREDSATWSEASVDPEMLGRAFESLMAETERRAGGVYYTPHELVARVADGALAQAAPSLPAARDLRILDPACGSGAFLVYALERLTCIRRDLGDPLSVAAVRRDVLARSIFGVDLSPTAVWLCELRLWLSVVIESDEHDPRRVTPLPNLDRNIRVGDSLAGAAFTSEPTLLVGGRRVLELRQRYLRATGARKRTAARQLDREERRRLVAQLDRALVATQHARGELLASLRSRDLFGDRPHRSVDGARTLRRLRDDVRRIRADRKRLVEGGALPFAFGSSFADIQARGGFDVVIGNPPWVRLHRIHPQLRAQFKRAYAVYRDAAWRAGAERSGAATAFASQVDLAALFVERSLALLRDRGVMSLLLPVKLWRSLAGGGVRRLLLSETCVRSIEDWSAATHAFDAAVYPSIVLAAKGGDPAPVAIVEQRANEHRRWSLKSASDVALDATSGAPWILVSRAVRDAFDRLQRSGTPLAAVFGAPRLGVKSGCNAAFVVRVLDDARGIAVIEDSNGERGKVESVLLRPALRGDAVRAWDRPALDEAIIWTHDTRGAPLARLPAHASTWLRRWYGDLARRSDARGRRTWWSLFRTDAADYMHPRVVWSDFGKRPRALVLPRGDAAVPLNTCYVVPCEDDVDALALAALLNAPLSAAWLNVVAEPARGGYHRYLGWTVGLLPLPRDWRRGRHILSQAARQSDDVLAEAMLEAFDLRHDDVAALFLEAPCKP